MAFFVVKIAFWLTKFSVVFGCKCCSINIALFNEKTKNHIYKFLLIRHRKFRNSILLFVLPLVILLANLFIWLDFGIDYWYSLNSSFLTYFLDFLLQSYLTGIRNCPSILSEFIDLKDILDLLFQSYLTGIRNCLSVLFEFIVYDQYSRSLSSNLIWLESVIVCLC